MTLPDWAGYQRFRPQFEQVTDPAFYPIEWLDFEVAQGRAWPIVGNNAAIVVEVRTYPGGIRAVHCLVAAGDMREIITDLADRGEELGRRHGCSVSLIESREGWKRALRPRGYEVHQLALIKEI